MTLMTQTFIYPNKEADNTLSRVNVIIPGCHLHCLRPTGVEGGGEWPPSSAKGWNAGFVGWQHNLSHWRLKWGSRLPWPPHLSLVMGSFHGVLAVGRTPQSWKRHRWSCTSPVFHYRIRVFRNAFVKKIKKKILLVNPLMVSLLQFDSLMLFGKHHVITYTPNSTPTGTLNDVIRGPCRCHTTPIEGFH